MSESELAQRFIASQAGIKDEALRRGKVAEREWPRILEAAEKLSAAPLYDPQRRSDGRRVRLRTSARRRIAAIAKAT